MLRLFSSLVLLSLALSACSHIYGDRGVIKDRDRDYLNAKSIPHLRQTPGSAPLQTKEHYPVPEHQYPGNPDVPLTPPNL